MLCAHWDGDALSFAPGVEQERGAGEDRLEETWRRYYASIFNPARLKVKAMQTEMPKKYWRNLPEASIIKPLIEDAERMTGAMIANAATDPHKPQKRPEAPMTRRDRSDRRSRSAPRGGRALPRLPALTRTRRRPCSAKARKTPPSCWSASSRATRKTSPAIPSSVRPARCSTVRWTKPASTAQKVYVTNAVKHFKFVPRGKIRLHQKPATPEIRACRQWYEREVSAIQPELIVAMGATAAQSVFGKIMPIGKTRGRLIDLPDGRKALVTVHPSYLLRLPDPEAKVLEYQRFVEDLKIAAGLQKKAARAA